MPIHVTVWNEFLHEKTRADVRRVYPEGIHAAITAGLVEQLADAVSVRIATLDQPDQGLPYDVLADTDVLFWWGHAAHDQVEDAVVDRVHARVLEGMGLVVLHSGHASKIFRRLMGTGCMLRWREAGERERLWIVAPGHPIVSDFRDEYFEIDHSEMYGELFDIPPPDELVLISWFAGGEVFRSGCTFRRGRGKVFYFAPGHETYPIYYDANVRRVLAGAARWAAPSGPPYVADARNIREPLEPV